MGKKWKIQRLDMPNIVPTIEITPFLYYLSFNEIEQNTDIQDRTVIYELNKERNAVIHKKVLMNFTLNTISFNNKREKWKFSNLLTIKGGNYFEIATKLKNKANTYHFKELLQSFAKIEELCMENKFNQIRLEDQEWESKQAVLTEYLTH